jgi:hypothetical protein
MLWLYMHGKGFVIHMDKIELYLILSFVVLSRLNPVNISTHVQRL